MSHVEHVWILLAMNTSGHAGIIGLEVFTVSSWRWGLLGCAMWSEYMCTRNRCNSTRWSVVVFSSVCVVHAHTCTHLYTLSCTCRSLRCWSRWSYSSAILLHADGALFDATAALTLTGSSSISFPHPICSYIVQQWCSTVFSLFLCSVDAFSYIIHIPCYTFIFFSLSHVSFLSCFIHFCISLAFVFYFLS